MLLLIGQVARAHRGREAFQEVEFTEMFAPLAKDAAEIAETQRVPEQVAWAYSRAMAGRPRAGCALAARGHARPRRPMRISSAPPAQRRSQLRRQPT